MLFFSIFLDSVDRDLFKSGQCFFIRSKLDFISNFLVFAVLKAPYPVVVEGNGNLAGLGYVQTVPINEEFIKQRIISLKSLILLATMVVN